MNNFLKPSLKNLILFVLLTASPSLWAADCVLQKEKDGQKLYWCQPENTEHGFYFLDLKGSMSETAYYHGLFLANAMDHGMLAGALEQEAKGFAQLTPAQQDQFRALEECAVDSYSESVSPEFRRVVHQTFLGYKAAGGKRSEEDTTRAHYLTEFSIYADALQRIMITDPGEAKKRVLMSCGVYLVGNEVLGLFERLGDFLSRVKIGCSGFSMPGNLTAQGNLIHGRNLDTGLIGYYEKHQVIIHITHPNGMETFTMSSAGMHYGGGVSGFNSSGLSISVHELQTTSPRLRYAANGTDMAPYLAQRILNQARSIDEAAYLVRNSPAFGAWTFLVSDSKTNEVASIEMNGSQSVVARRVKQQSMAQTNHFLSPITQATGYEYSMNKSLETRARFQFIEDQLDKNKSSFEVQSGINLLSGHWDSFVGARTFGRTTTKIYTAATHVMIPARNEWWMSTGEVYPTNRSPFVGFHWNAQLKKPEMIGVNRAVENLAPTAWYDSMSDFVNAYMSYESEVQRADGLEKALPWIEKAILKSEAAGVTEFPYYFMRARSLLLKAAFSGDSADLQRAQQSWMYLRQLVESNSIKTHDYEVLQVLYWNYRLQQWGFEKNKIAIEANLQANILNRIKNLQVQYPTQVELKKLQSTLEISNLQDWIIKEGLHFPTIE